MINSYADFESLAKELSALVTPQSDDGFEIISQPMELLDLSDSNLQVPNDRPLHPGFGVIAKLFTSLNLSASKLNKFSARLFAQNIKGDVALKNLNLSNNNLEAEGIKALKNLNLQVLNVSKCELGVGGAPHVSHIIANTQIRELYASSNKFKVEGARIIARSLEETKSLEILDLGSNIIRDKGMNAITESLFESVSLNVLSIKNNELKDEAFNKFIKSYMGHPAHPIRSALFSSNEISIYALRLTD